MQHFFVNQDLSGSHAVITDCELLHQLLHVLRFEKNDECVLLDGNGGKSNGIVETIDKKAAIMKLNDYQTFEKLKRSIALYIAISKKPATFEFIIQKATELGVTDIIPIITERCQVREIRNEKRLLTIIKESAEQCERVFLPKFHPVLKFTNFIENPPPGKILTGDARMHDIELGKTKISANESVNLVIGPEGGLTEKELSEIHKIGGQIFILGSNVLRMETAAVATLAVILFR
ncbi:MAG: RsmE family RNA methyltransferase [Candidatus Gracilibacteria bacterium]|jgi:16S rRNA (uracil1498-N3)-methyltransferase